MEPLASLEKKVKFLETAFRPLANVRFKMEGLKECYLQALLSRGDRRLTPLLTRMAHGMNMKKSAALCDIDTDWLVSHTIAHNEPLPWDIITTGDHSLLEREFNRAMQQEE
jgi:hypothetical protein